MLTLKEFRDKAQKLQTLYVAARSGQILAGNRTWEYLEEETTSTMMDNINTPDAPRHGYAYGRNIAISLVGWETTSENLEKFIKENKLQTTAYWAYLFALDEAHREDGIANEVYSSTTIDLVNFRVIINLESYVQSHPITRTIEQHPAYKMLQLMQTTTINKNHVGKAQDRYKTQTRVFAQTTPTTNGDGIKKLLEQKPIVHESTIIKQLEELENKITNNLTARTWGFEIEVPDAKDVKAPTGIEKGDDGSLRSYESDDDCNCDCDDCCYHDCDCDWCDNRNPDPDHCGSSSCANCDSAEYRSIGGIQRMQHAGMNELCKNLNEENAEMNDSAGTHIHVYAQELTTQQVGQVLLTYAWLDTIIKPIAGRKNVNYAMPVPVQYISKAVKRNQAALSTEKPREVNCMHLFNGRGTLEFRQMDCNLNAKRITAWAWLVRGLVTAAKRGATIRDYRNCTDLNGVVSVLAKFNIEPNNENPEEIVYGSKTDAERVAPLAKQHQKIN